MIRMTFRVHDDQCDSPGRRAFAERCCALLTERVRDLGLDLALDLDLDLDLEPAPVPEQSLTLDVLICTGKRCRAAAPLPPLSIPPAVVSVPVRVPHVPQVAANESDFEQLVVGSLGAGVGATLRRNPDLQALALATVTQMSSRDPDPDDGPGVRT